MIDPDVLSRARFRVTLPANAPARLAPPPEDDGGPWWRIGGATWVRALPKRSVLVQKPDDVRSILVRFRSDGPGLEMDEDAGWVRNSDAVKGLAAELVEGILRQFDASVPALPTIAQPLPPTEPQLDWPDGAPGLPEARRWHRLAGSVALAEYLDRVARDEGGDRPAAAAPTKDVANRLVHHLSAIPRPAEARMSLSWEGDGGPVLSWDQTGNPELLWRARALSWGQRSCNVVVTRLPPEEADGQRRLGVWAHLLAMATAVESATGGVGVPLRLRYRTVGDRPVTATFTISPAQWGFELPRLVQVAGQGQVPGGLRLRITS